MAKLLLGKPVAAQIKDRVKGQVAQLKAEGVTATLAVVLVGDDEASAVYVRGKQADCTYCGIATEKIHLPASVDQQALLACIERLNKDEKVSGILVQLPLPAHLDEKAVIACIDPDKDVDAFHSVNTGKLVQGAADFLPCTPAGIVALLDAYEIPIEGKHCVVIGRSNIVGKPLALLMLGRDATVSICHSRTQGLGEITRQGDIVVAAVGKAHFLAADMVKQGACVVDVGIHRGENGLCGDVDFASVAQVAEAITPVPGGVGLMTRATLMENTLKAAVAQAKRQGIL